MGSQAARRQGARSKVAALPVPRFFGECCRMLSPSERGAADASLNGERSGRRPAARSGPFTGGHVVGMTTLVDLTRQLSDLRCELRRLIDV